jgi:hypothetical protein
MYGRRSLHARLVGCAVVLLLTGGCEAGGGAQPFVVVPGPTVPSPVPTAAPYVWDTRDELDIWVNNPVSGGRVPVSLVGDGRDAVIRIVPKLGLDGWTLRGPDFSLPARGIRGVRIWYRWQPDPTLPKGAVQTFSMSVSFEATNPPHPPEQPQAFAQLQPASEPTEANIQPGSFRDSLDVKYVYFHQSSSNPGVFEIDRIELVQ